MKPIKVLSIFLATFILGCGGGGGGGGGGGAASESSGDSGSSSGGATPTPTPTPVASNDPLFQYAWHLKNTGQTTFNSYNGTSGKDINLGTLHDDDKQGEGIKIAVSDGGIEITHEDLSGNILSGQSRNYNLASPYVGSPAPASNTDKHGTFVMGIIGAVGFNGKGSRGVAPKASLAGFYYLTGSQTLSMYIDQAGGSFDIFNYSYGAWACQFTNVSSSYVSKVKDGVTNLRSGKGAIYITSAGNDYTHNLKNCDSGYDGTTYYGNSNFDQIKSYPYYITVGALNSDGTSASYSTPGSNIWISAPGGDKNGIVSTDLEGCNRGSAVDPDNSNPFDKNTNSLNSGCNYSMDKLNSGTSYAAPVISGVVALMLEANSNLTWRDVKHILASTATKVHPTATATTHPGGFNLSGHTYEQGWITNSAGYNFHNYYGFGGVNASSAVSTASSYTSSLGTQKETINPNNNNWYYDSGTISLNIPDNNATGVSSTLNVKHNYLIESVQVKLSLTHPFSHQLGFELTSPSGRKSILKNINSNNLMNNLTNVTLLTNAFYGESSSGNWTLKVIDGASGSTGTLTNWKINIWGHINQSRADTTAPNSVTGLTANSHHNSTTASPTINFTNSSSGDVLRYEGCVGTSSTDCSIADWEYIPVSPPFSKTELTLTNGNTYFFNIRVIDTSENVSTTSSLSWIADTTAPSPPTSLVNTSYNESLTSTPSFSFTASSSSDIARYEYSIGTSSGATNSLDWTSNGTSLSIQRSGLSLTANSTYYLNIRAVDNAGNVSSTLTGNWKAISCPSGYVFVKPNTNLNTNYFCVMKYEAKAWKDLDSDGVIDAGEVSADGCSSHPTCSGGEGVLLNNGYNPVSVAEGRPFREIRITSAKSRCQSLGTGYDLISNPESMAIAREIESNTSNWSGGSVGNGFISTGNSLAAGGRGYYAGTNEFEGGTGRNTLARHYLASGEEIWDFAGNVEEWTDWTTGGSLSPGPTTCTQYNVQITDTTCPSLNDDSFNTKDGVNFPGAGYFYSNSNGYVKRGGFLGNNSGIYNLRIVSNTTESSRSVGFRCVFRP